MSGPELITLGCRLNIAESEAMRTAAAGQDDLVIVNSCAVTAQAVRETRKVIRRARRDRPDARIMVTGCAAEIEPERFSAMPEVSRVLRLAEKFDPASFEGSTRRHSPSVPRVEPGVTNAAHARAFVAVQNGCDHACTFCIIPQGRGPSRSEPAGAVIAQIAALVDAGHREIVLTGVDLTSYGPDLPGQPTLGLLVERILRHVPALERLRLSSLDPAEIDDRLFDLITGEPRLMPYLHLSLQAGDDLILKRMKRRHSRAQAVTLVERVKARRPETTIGADLIAGFPTETAAAAANSLALIEDCDIVFAHVFPYSPRAGTPAARMPQIAPEIGKSRAAALRARSEQRRAAWLETQVGTLQRVLLEGDGTSGHGESFAKVTLEPLPFGGGVGVGTVNERPARQMVPTPDPSPEGEGGSGFRRGDVVSVRITATDADILIGTPA